MIGGSIWILFGGVLLGERLHLISSGLRFWPLLLVAVGGWIVVQVHDRRAGAVRRDRFLGSSIGPGGAGRRRSTGHRGGFQGADITAFMGGGKLDLREAKIARRRKRSSTCLAVMGGFEIVTSRRRGTSSSTWSRLWEDTRTRRGHPADPSAPRLRLRGFVMMGGLEVRN